MAARQILEHHIRRFDIPRIFHGQCTENPETVDQFLNKILHTVDTIFTEFRHLIDAANNGPCWIRDVWNKAAHYNYVLASTWNNPPPPTVVHSGRVLQHLNPAHLPQQQAPGSRLYLFSGAPDHWYFPRSYNGVAFCAKGDDCDPPLINAFANQIGALVNVGQNQYGAGQCIDARAIAVCAQHGAVTTVHQPYKATTAVMHLVYPQFLPVWYIKTKAGYSQVVGMDLLLSLIAERVPDCERRHDLDMYGDYNHYAAVYRFLLFLYNQYIENATQQNVNFQPPPPRLLYPIPRRP